MTGSRSTAELRRNMFFHKLPPLIAFELFFSLYRLFTCWDLFRVNENPISIKSARIASPKCFFIMEAQSFIEVFGLPDVDFPRLWIIGSVNVIHWSALPPPAGGELRRNMKL